METELPMVTPGCCTIHLKTTGEHFPMNGSWVKTGMQNGSWLIHVRLLIGIMSLDSGIFSPACISIAVHGIICMMVSLLMNVAKMWEITSRMVIQFVKHGRMVFQIGQLTIIR